MRIEPFRMSTYGIDQLQGSATTATGGGVSPGGSPDISKAVTSGIDLFQSTLGNVTRAGGNGAAALPGGAATNLFPAGSTDISQAVNSGINLFESTLNNAAGASGAGGNGASAAPGRQVMEGSDGPGPTTQFGQQVSQAVHYVDGLQKNADSLATQVATGGTEDAHKAVVAMEHALMSLDFTLQVRNKVLDAYQEIMKTQM